MLRHQGQPQQTLGNVPQIRATERHTQCHTAQDGTLNLDLKNIQLNESNITSNKCFAKCSHTNRIEIADQDPDIYK